MRGSSNDGEYVLAKFENTGVLLHQKKLYFAKTIKKNEKGGVLDFENRGRYLVFKMSQMHKIA
jgi:hypothetical protein